MDYSNVMHCAGNSIMILVFDAFNVNVLLTFLTETIIKTAAYIYSNNAFSNLSHNFSITIVIRTRYQTYLIGVLLSNGDI